MSISEEILGNSVRFIKGLLEDPNIWVSDMIGFDPTYELKKDINGEQIDIEKLVTETIFT